MDDFDCQLQCEDADAMTDAERQEYDEWVSQQDSLAEYIELCICFDT